VLNRGRTPGLAHVQTMGDRGKDDLADTANIGQRLLMLSAV